MKTWTPLIGYNEQGVEYLLHGRRKKNGLIVFRTTKATRLNGLSYSTPGKNLDLESRFNSLLTPAQPDKT